MSILKVARMGHPVLRAKARALDRADFRNGGVQKLIDDLIDTMIEYHGVGLAAPQVHEGLRLFVAMLDANETGDSKSEPVVVINPEITPVGNDIVDGWEGCLSVDGLRGRVIRPSMVRVRGLDRHGQPVDLEATGLYAVCIQHEMDHLIGKVFLDRMTDLSTLSQLDEFERFWKEEHATVI